MVERPVLDQTEQGIRLIEDERRRIARDLHDGPAQALTNVSMRLEILKHMIQASPELAISEVDKINHRLVSAINNIRRLIYDLRPLAIEEVGLIAATKDLCKRCEQEWGITFEVCVSDVVTDDNMNPVRQVALYRIVQEILSNIRKHACATLVQVDIHRRGNDIEIVIRDNGTGFDPTNIPAGHYGLIGMQERAVYLGGRLDILSEINQGSQFTITVPIS
jgi:two-component system sensor histidine kinase DegS